MKKLITDTKKCTGCRSCMLACSGGHYQSYSLENSRIKVVKLEDIGTDIPIVCKQCNNAPCIKACPVGALTKDEKTNATIVNKQECIGCGLCAEACPFGAIVLDSEEYPMVCDLCQGEPRCAEVCPVGAIAFKDTNAAVEKKRTDVAMRESKKVLKKWGIRVASL